MTSFLILLIRGYQIFLSPLLTALSGAGGCCRFHPTCSEYAIMALREHGLWNGFFLSFKRIVRCHPWGGSGFDPVPNARHPHHSHDSK
ncbi:MAG: membrane protein insertion efficiency factor YidD [Candidatus Methylacidiphilales bacterium]